MWSLHKFTLRKFTNRTSLFRKYIYWITKFAKPILTHFFIIFSTIQTIIFYFHILKIHTFLQLNLIFTFKFRFLFVLKKNNLITFFTTFWIASNYKSWSWVSLFFLLLFFYYNCLISLFSHLFIRFWITLIFLIWIINIQQLSFLNHPS